MGKRRALNFKPYSLHGTSAYVHIPSCKLGFNLTKERGTRLVSYIESLLWERERGRRQKQAGQGQLSEKLPGWNHNRLLHRDRLKLLFCRLLVSEPLWLHWLQHTRLPCPSPSPGVCSNSSLLSWWCHPTISSSVAPLLLLPSIFPSIRVFSNEWALCIRWPKYWSFSFSISPSNEYSVLNSFIID